MINSYELKEAAVASTLSALAAAWMPAYFWLIVVSTVTGYVALVILSKRAFRRVWNAKMVREVRGAPGARKAFVIAPDCPHRWLVTRYIRARL